MSKKIFFTDLDDTLLQSNKKVPDCKKSIPISSNREKEWIGRATKTQVILKEMMEREGWLIPVTGRNKDALYRINWSWESFQAVSHGALVLNKDGSLNEKWLSLIENEIKESKKILFEINELVRSKVEGTKIDSKVLNDQGIDVYVSVKNRVNEDISSDLAIEIENKIPKGWRVHLNGRNMAILPPYASKARAVSFIKKEHGHTENDLVIGLGDSVSDLEFMNECDFMIIPNVSQVNTLLKKLKLIGQ